MLTKSCLLIGVASHVRSHSQVNFVGPRAAPGVSRKHTQKKNHLVTLEVGLKGAEEISGKFRLWPSRKKQKSII